MKTKFFTILCLFFLTCSLKAQFYTFREYNHKDGLKISTTLFTTQDSSGYLYIGTDGNGIVKFDGNTFKDITPKKIDHSLHVTGFTTIGDEAFISTLYSSIVKFSVTTGDTIYFPKLIQYGSFFSIESYQKKLCAVTQQGVLLFDSKGKVIQHRPFAEQTVFIQQIKTAAGVIIFTSNGDYLVSDQKILLLNDVLGIEKINFHCGTIENNLFTCYSLSERKAYSFTIENGQFKLKSRFKLFGTTIDFNQINKADAFQDKLIFTTNQNLLFTIDKGVHIKQIQPNFHGDIGIVTNVFVDRAKDFWVNTMYGIVKVSNEPFTKIELNPYFQDYNFLSNYFTSQGDYLLTSSLKGTLKGNFNTGEMERLPNLFIKEVVKCPLGTIVFTVDDILELRNNQLVKSNILPELEAKFSFAMWENGNLWIGTKDKGLIRYHAKTKSSTTVVSATSYNVIYCGQVTNDGKVIYFGTNNGVISFDTKTLTSRHVSQFEKLGFFCGNSTKDKYGTIWFTLDKGIAGIRTDGSYCTITNKNDLPSYLLYSLSADKLGNLIVGTNLGIHILKVNEQGQVIRSRTYSYNNGFQGFETNMGSAFQLGNTTMVGTTQGLYLINTTLLERYTAPPKPVIRKGRLLKNGKFSADEGSFLTFETILPKVKDVWYYYRIESKSKQWVKLNGTNELHLPDFENGDYIIDVKSSYNGLTFSKTTKYQLEINNPIWKSKWFILFIILFIAIINFGYIEWSKNDVQVNFYETNYNYVDYDLVPKLFVFGGVANLLMGLLTHFFIDPKLGGIIPYIITSLLLFSLRFVLSYFRNAKKERITTYCFYVGMGSMYLQFYYLMYESNMHPYSLIAVILITGCLPFLIQNIKSILIMSSGMVLLAMVVLIFVEKPLYNEVLFTMAISTSAGLTIVITYLRNANLKKMNFASNILNKGNMMVLAFDQKGLINFCSQNIARYFFINADQLMGKPLGNLNPLVATSEMREMSLETEFEDGKTFLVPMYDRKSEIIWIEWSCKYISIAARVILGQDVTEKIKLTTNYESLVENATDLIYMTDIETNFTFLNEMSYKVFGFRKESLIGKSSIFIVHPDYREKVQKFYENQFRSRIQNTYLEFPIKAKDGKVVWLGQNVSLIHEPGIKKRISGFSALARDITEKRMNELLIDQQNKDITSSINSAKRIQYGLIPKATEFAKYFENHFVFFKPKDIVSGDFYWIHKQDGKLIIVVADSTGYGVPGAFMTILGISLLNQIVKERKITDAAGILNALNNELQSVIHQHSAMTVIDDMEALIVVMDERSVQFSSSGVILIHNHDAEMDLYRRTKVDETDPNSVYKAINIQVNKEDNLYLLSDGYQKQFGSLKNKKFSLKNVLELLRKIQNDSLNLQKKHIENTLSDWSEGHEQTDDIIFIGINNYIANSKDSN